MTVDVRCIVTCSLGTVISGNIADDYIQGNGLILCRGAVEIAGLITPAVGTAVTFAYKRNGGTRAIPRKLRVLSSFADPLRRTTKVQLGCKLTYLQDKRDRIDWTAFDDSSNSNFTADDAQKITVPISAVGIANKCLNELGISASSMPLTNSFSIPKFDFSPGYVAVLSDLLVSECYCGYLDTNEVLQVFSLNQDGGTAPVVSTSDLIEIADINSGQLPGEAVVVSYTTLRLKKDDAEALDWTKSKSSVTGEYSVIYRSPVVAVQGFGGVQSFGGQITTAVYPTLDTTEEFTDYVTLDIPVGVDEYKKIDVVRKRTVATTQTTPMVLGSVTVQLLEKGFGVPFGQVERTVEELFYYDRFGNEIKMERTTTASQAYAWGQAGLPAVVYEPPLNGAPGAYRDVAVSLNLGGTFLEERLVVETAILGAYKKITTTKYGPWSKTIPGQQALAEMGKVDFETTAQVEAFFNQYFVNSGYLLSINVRTEENTSKGQTAPVGSAKFNQPDPGSTANPDLEGRTQSVSKLALAVGSATAQRRIELSLPYAPDDIFIKQGPGVYTSIPSNAESKARAFGRVQNRLLLGNRNGMNLQLDALHMPETPFAPLVVNLSGAAALYRTNATSWTFNAEGLVVSTDALFWGGVSGTSPWFPVAPGVTSLPSLPTTSVTNVTGVDASGNTVTIGTVLTLTVGGVVRPYNETVIVPAATRTRMVVTNYPYSLQQSTALAVTTKTKAIAARVKLIDVPAAALTVTAAAPSVSIGVRVVVPAAAAVSMAALTPAVASGASVAVPAAAVAVAGVVPDLVGRPKTVVEVPSADVAVTGLVPLVTSGASIAVPVADVAVAGAVPAVVAGVTMLLHMDGSNNSTTFTDSSSTPLTLTANGNSKISTTQSKFGGASGYFDGNGDFLSAAYNADFDLLGSDFTVECWVYAETFKSSMRVAAAGGGTVAWNSTNGIHWLMNFDATGAMDLQIRNTAGVGSVKTTATVLTNTWTHIAVCVSGSTGYAAIGGTVVSGSLGTIQRPSTNPTFNLCSIPGENGASSIAFQGYIDDFRITKGRAIYTANYTPPAAAFPNP